jgi:hypothetical protein
VAHSTGNSRGSVTGYLLTRAQATTGRRTEETLLMELSSESVVLQHRPCPGPLIARLRLQRRVLRSFLSPSGDVPCPTS